MTRAVFSACTEAAGQQAKRLHREENWSYERLLAGAAACYLDLVGTSPRLRR